MAKADERDKMLFEFGLLVDPLRRLIDDPEIQRKLPFTEARLKEELAAFSEALRAYCGSGGFVSSHAHVRAHNAVCEFGDFLRPLYGGGVTVDGAKVIFDHMSANAVAAIRALPAEDVGAVLAGASPFTTYRRLVEVCRAGQKRLELFDPYLDKEVYLRYLDEVDPAVRVVVVTAEKLMQDIPRRDRIIAVSELFAVERPNSYELRVVSSLHDRHLRIDDAIYRLGGSVKDAGKKDPFTISNLGPTQAAHQSFDDLIARGVEWIGPSVKQHRRQV